jgi:hypothetical protein
MEETLPALAGMGTGLVVMRAGLMLRLRRRGESGTRREPGT